MGEAIVAAAEQAGTESSWRSCHLLDPVRELGAAVDRATVEDSSRETAIYSKPPESFVDEISSCVRPWPLQCGKTLRAELTPAAISGRRLGHLGGIRQMSSARGRQDQQDAPGWIANGITPVTSNLGQGRRPRNATTDPSLRDVSVMPWAYTPIGRFRRTAPTTTCSLHHLYRRDQRSALVAVNLGDEPASTRQRRGPHPNCSASTVGRIVRSSRSR